MLSKRLVVEVTIISKKTVEVTCSVVIDNVVVHINIGNCGYRFLHICELTVFFIQFHQQQQQIKCELRIQTIIKPHFYHHLV